MDDRDNQHQQGGQFGGGTRLTVKQQKQTYFIIFFALVGSVGTYLLLCFLMSQNRRPLTPAPAVAGLITVLAIVALIASIAWLQFRTSGRAGDAPAMSTTTPSALMSPAEFQTETIIAMALAEACAILGLLLFFMGGPLKGFIPFAAGTLAVDLAYILPRALRYWAAYEKPQQPNNSPFAL
jgi:hypothetical protein